MKATATLTPEESKRLIARAIVELDIVKRAKKSGTIGLARCTSCGYVAEELIGRPLKDRGRYISGFICDKGLCATPSSLQEKLLVLEKGQEVWLDYTQGNVSNFIERMGCHDVIVKSGNAIDPEGNVGCLVAAPNAGEIGAYLPHILAKGINLVIPMTLNKTVAVPIRRIVGSLGISRLELNRTHGLLCGMMPMPGLVVTEAEALRQLTGAEAFPVAVGGIGRGAGAVVLLIQGDDEQVERAWRLVQQIKSANEASLNCPPTTCQDCYIRNSPEMGARCSGFQG